MRISPSLYVALMLVASGLSLLRGFVVAFLVDPIAFGTYAIAIGIGAITAMVASLGSVEQTWKTFVIGWAQGRIPQTVAASRRLDLILFLRIAAPTSALALAALAIGQANIALMIAAVGCYALPAILVSAGGSFLRASTDMGPLAVATLIRAVVALAAAAMGAYLFSWPGAVMGEVVGIAAFVSFVEWKRRQALRQFKSGQIETGQIETGQIETGPATTAENTGPKSDPETGPKTAHKERTGRYVFAANFIISLPIFLDRLFVSTVFGPQITAIYGVLILFNTGALTLTGVIEQRAGAMILRIQNDGADFATVFRYALKWIAIIAAGVLLAMATAAILLFVGPMQSIAEKYQLTPQLFAATTALCLSGICLHLNWVCVAYKQEKTVLNAALVQLSCVATLALYTIIAKPDLTTFILNLAAARATQPAFLFAKLIAFNKKQR